MTRSDFAEFIADLHVHSYLSRATSAQCDLPHLALWAQRKGIGLLGTGDFTHPEWFARIEEELSPLENGFFELRPDLQLAVGDAVPRASQRPVRFVLQVEISSIYKRHGRVRKVHNLIFVPDLDAARRLCEALGRIGNITSDGRPILGLDSRDLLEITLSCSDRARLIPAHIWTPWFSVFGSKSGFDTLEECYGDLTPQLFALETGLSSDPPMNWRLSQLDGLTLVSNSDAHSPAKLGREANLFRCPMTYDDVFGALRDGDPQRFGGTLEFFPEEGKYHLDGCRKCSARLAPAETKALDGRCPQCGRLITVGVMHRVDTLADRAPGARPTRALPFESLVPLAEVLGECVGQGPATKRVRRAYDQLLRDIGPELAILRSVPLDLLERSAVPLLHEAIRRIRAGDVHLEAGYDGEFGVVRVFRPGEREKLLGQADLFPSAAPDPAASASPGTPVTPYDAFEPTVATGADVPFGVPNAEAPGSEGLGATEDEFVARGQLGLFGAVGSDPPVLPPTPLLAGLTEAQRSAVYHDASALLIVAGPGTGKTRTLTRWIAHRAAGSGSPHRILAVTFTNRAAREMRQRLAALLDPGAARAMTVTTFHAYGLQLLRRYADRLGLPPDFPVLDEAAAAEVYALARGQVPTAALRGELRELGNLKLRRTASAARISTSQQERLVDYEAALRARGAVDYADLILRALALLEDHTDVAASERERWQCIAVDEYQDIDPGQRDLLRLIRGPDTAICAIGDPDQSIYAFRGADVQLFKAFTADHGAARIGLGLSFRSTAPILRLAQAVVAPAFDHGRVPVTAVRDDTGTPTVLCRSFPSPEAEAAQVAADIEALVGSMRSLSAASGAEAERLLGFGDVAVLARTGARLEPVAEACGRVGIPTERIGLPAPDAADESLLLALLRAAVGSPSSVDLLRLLLAQGLTRRGIAPFLPSLAEVTDVETLCAAAEKLSLDTALRKGLAKVLSLVRLVREQDAPLGPDTECGAVLARAAAALSLTWPPALGASALSRLWALASPSGVGADAVRASAEALSVAALIDGRATCRLEDGFYRAERVALLTLHASKGLEFEAVFVVGCEDGTVPWQAAAALTQPEADEERRLLYVGLTRAGSRLQLSAARNIRRHGEVQARPLSRFLTGLDPGLLEVQEVAPRRPKRRQLDLL